MKITLNKEKSTVTVNVLFETEEWIKHQDKAYEKLGKDVTVKGFRKGQAPLVQLKRNIASKDMFDEALNTCLEEAYAKVLKENDLDLVARPAYDVVKFSDTELELKFTLIVRPEVTLGNYKGIVVKKDPIVVEDSEIDAKLEEYRQQYATIATKESGVIEEGDTVRFDFEGFVDGKPFDGGKANGFELVIGSHQFIPGFEEQMVGLKVGEKKDITVTFPEQYTPELAGKEAVFKLHIHEVSIKNLPEINDDLALDVAIEGVDTLEQLKEHIKHDLEHHKSHQVEDKAFQQLINTIVDGSEVEINEKVLEEQLDIDVDNFKQRVSQQGLTFEKYLEVTGSTLESLKEQMKPETQKHLKSSFVLGDIATKEGIKVSEEDVEEEFKNMATMYGMEVEKIKQALKGQENAIANDIYSRKLTNLLKELNTIE